MEADSSGAPPTVWRSEADFEAWTRSQAFHANHAKVGSNSALGFESVLELQPKGRAA